MTKRKYEPEFKNKINAYKKFEKYDLVVFYWLIFQLTNTGGIYEINFMEY